MLSKGCGNAQFDVVLGMTEVENTLGLQIIHSLLKNIFFLNAYCQAITLQVLSHLLRH